MDEIVREAKPADLTAIYLMGFDAWGEGSSETDYLKGCESSPKYKRGTWFVIEGNGNLKSSLITYQFENGVFGIGSISTPKSFRNQGWASKLISSIITQIEQSHKSPRIFLYSDITPEFYQRFGFDSLPKIAQRYKSSVCMVKGIRSEEFVSSDQTPEYF